MSPYDATAGSWVCLRFDQNMVIGSTLVYGIASTAQIAGKFFIRVEQRSHSHLVKNYMYLDPSCVRSMTIVPMEMVKKVWSKMDAIRSEDQNDADSIWFSI